MKKRDFIQTASIQFMPQTDWDINKSIRYAEKLWLKLGDAGYGEAKASEPRDMVNYYQKLSGTSKKQFDQFWVAFDYKSGKQRAAMRWAQLGEFDQNELKKLVNAAKQIASYRKQNADQTPVMAERWLSERRFEDVEQTDSEKNGKKNNLKAMEIRELTSTLNHAKKMAGSCSDDFWTKDIERLTEALRQLRAN